MADAEAGGKLDGPTLSGSGTRRLVPMPTTFKPAELQQLRNIAEIHIAPHREDGTPTTGTTIWVVVVDGHPYLRSVRAGDGHWYRTILRSRRATLRAGSIEFECMVEPVDDADLNRKIDAALRDKYQSRWAGPTATMLKPEVAKTTLRVLPA